MTTMADSKAQLGGGELWPGFGSHGVAPGADVWFTGVTASHGDAQVESKVPQSLFWAMTVDPENN